MSESDASEEYSYYRIIEPSTPRWEIVWMKPDLPYFRFLQLRLLDNEGFTGLGYAHDRFDNALEYLKSIMEKSDSTTREDCIYCQGLFSNRLDHPEVCESTSEISNHLKEYSLPHAVVHYIDYYGDQEVEIFDTLDDALDLDNSDVGIARPGDWGSYDGDAVMGSVYVKTSDSGTLWGDSINLQAFGDCKCEGELSIFSMMMCYDNLVFVGRIPSSVKSFEELEDLVAEEDTHYFADYADLFWKSIVATDENWAEYHTQWLGCSVCMKPVYGKAIDGHLEGAFAVHKIDMSSAEFSNWLLSKVFDELLSTSASKDVWTDLEKILLVTDHGGRELADAVMAIDEQRLKNMIQKLPAEIRNLVPELVQKFTSSAV